MSRMRQEELVKQKNVVELFAGVGGFRLGLDKAGWKTVFANQWEPGAKRQWAFECYDKHFPDSVNLNVDVATIPARDVPDCALLVGGFPCQDYSVASTLVNSKGIEGKKGVLWWEILRIATAKKPPFILLENVDRLLKSPAKQRGRDFGMILACLNNIGYSVEWRVINAADYGFSQRRRRTFIFATRMKDTAKDLYGKKTPEDVILSSGFFAPAFPCAADGKTKLAEIKVPDDIVVLSDNFSAAFANAGFCIKGKCWTMGVLPSYDGPVATLGSVLEDNVDAKYLIPEKDLPKWEYMKGAKKEARRAANGHEYFYTEGPIAYPDFLDRPSRTLLTGESTKNRSSHVVVDKTTGKYRVLTPVECERLDGFPDGWTDTGMPESMRYFCMGNALVVGLIEKMGKRLDELI